MPPLKGPLDAGAAALRNAKNAGKNIDQQLPIAVNAAVEELPQTKAQRMFVYVAGGAVLLMVVVMLMRRGSR